MTFLSQMATIVAWHVRVVQDKISKCLISHHCETHLTTFRICAMSSCPKKNSVHWKQSSRPDQEVKGEKRGNNGCSRGAHLIVRICILGRVVAQNLHYAPPALNPDAGARIAALRILQPFFELVRCHVDLLV